MYDPPRNDAIPMAMMTVMINPLNVDFLHIFSFFLIIFSKFSEAQILYFKN